MTTKAENKRKPKPLRQNDFRFDVPRFCPHPHVCAALFGGGGTPAVLWEIMETIIPAGMITLKKSARPKHAFLFLNEKKYLHRASILTKLTNASSLENALLVRPSPRSSLLASVGNKRCWKFEKICSPIGFGRLLAFFVGAASRLRDEVCSVTVTFGCQLCCKRWRPRQQRC